MNITCIIVEDEPLALQRTRGYVEQMPDLDLLATFDNAGDAIAFLHANTVGLILLDINLGDLSGIELLETTKIKSAVIITTAYPEHALKGYDLDVTDYLLKPFTFPRFEQAITKVQARLSVQPVRPERKYIFIKTEYRLEKLSLDDILFIEGKGDYRKIHTLRNSILTLQTFKDLEASIPSSKIARVHKSYMVSIDKIDRIENDRIWLNKIVIPISDTYKKSFFETINEGKS